MGWGLAVCKPSRAGKSYWGQESTGPELNWYQTVLTVSTAPIAPAFDSLGPRLDASQTASTTSLGFGRAGSIWVIAWNCQLGTASKPCIEHWPVWQWWRCGEREMRPERGEGAGMPPGADAHLMISASSIILRDSNRNGCVLVTLETYWSEGKRPPTSFGRARMRMFSTKIRTDRAFSAPLVPRQCYMNSPKVNSDRASPMPKSSSALHARQKATRSAKQSAGVAWAQLSKYQNPGLDHPCPACWTGAPAALTGPHRRFSAPPESCDPLRDRWCVRPKVDVEARIGCAGANCLPELESEDHSARKRRPALAIISPAAEQEHHIPMPCAGQGTVEDRQVNGGGGQAYDWPIPRNRNPAGVEEQTETFQTTAKEGFPGGEWKLRASGARECNRMILRRAPKASRHGRINAAFRALGLAIGIEEVWVLAGWRGEGGVDDGTTMGR
ncbi:hypothetical protein NA56DRAFT_701720 [Hyaloscypha hepaticicola]|uniref:Uncharacterized protein n=1 Tax=Hyaloscypha hepaticicola TaxID=2082293 RepID=A0A2J6QB20_9HELO|nr:hypothetical protein NA56DRAFT_701720 [Hyaloscypha hepaticicola]